MKVKLLDRKINEIEADFEVILVVDKNLNHEFIKDADKLALFNYKGEGNLLLAESGRLYVGVKALEYDRVRTALASAYNTLKGYAIKNCLLQMRLRPQKRDGDGRGRAFGQL